MKAIAHLLAILLLLIVISPVMGIMQEEEAVTCCSDHCSEDTTQAPATDKSSDDSSCNSCNPFFNCACYTVLMVGNQQYSLQKKLLPTQHLLFFYKGITPLQLNIPFWQPPKLSA